MRKRISETTNDAVIYAKKTLAIERLSTNDENFRFTQAYLNGSISSDQAIAKMKKYILNKKMEDELMVK